MIVAARSLAEIPVVVPVTVLPEVTYLLQTRIGPNRVGPQGILQWLCDGVKCFLKEDLICEGADRPLFRLSAYLAFVPVLVGMLFGAVACVALFGHMHVMTLVLGASLIGVAVDYLQGPRD